MFPGRNARSPGIRTVSAVATVVFGIVALLVTAGLVWTSGLLQLSMEAVTLDTRSSALANELELSLLTYHRLANLHALTGESPLAVSKAELETAMERLLQQAGESVRSAREQQLLDKVAAHLGAYLEERRLLEAREDDLEDILSSMQPAFERTIAELESLRDLNDAQVAEAHDRAIRVNRSATVVGLTAGAVLVLELLLVAVGMRRHVLSPVLGLHAAIAKLRAGDGEARVTRGGLREIDELAQGLNELADGLARQRESQLTFLAGVAHDLRNPLAALKFGIYALQHEQSETTRRGTGMRLERQIDRLARMIEDLLDATRIEAGKLALKAEDLDVRDSVRDMIELYAPTSPDHEIVVEMPADPVTIHGDPLRIEQVISNLLSNAIKFSPRGRQIEVTVAAEDEEAVLAVSDRGVGISREELAQIFLPFRRRAADTTPGAGLGLSVVRRIVTAHGGRIDVDSEAGEGSTFRVRIPLARSGAGRSDASQRVTT